MTKNVRHWPATTGRKQNLKKTTETTETVEKETSSESTEKD